MPCPAYLSLTFFDADFFKIVFTICSGYRSGLTEGERATAKCDLAIDQPQRQHKKKKNIPVNVSVKSFSPCRQCVGVCICVHVEVQTSQHVFSPACARLYVFCKFALQVFLLFRVCIQYARNANIIFSYVCLCTCVCAAPLNSWIQNERWSPPTHPAPLSEGRACLPKYTGQSEPLLEYLMWNIELGWDEQAVFGWNISAVRTEFPWKWKLSLITKGRTIYDSHIQIQLMLLVIDNMIKTPKRQEHKQSLAPGADSGCFGAGGGKTEKGTSCRKSLFIYHEERALQYVHWRAP